MTTNIEAKSQYKSLVVRIFTKMCTLEATLEEDTLHKHTGVQCAEQSSVCDLLNQFSGEERHGTYSAFIPECPC